MKNNKYYKSTYSDFKKTFDDIFGFDIASFWINDDYYHGCLEKSPIEDRLVSNFNYTPIYDESKKPYRAHWMINDSRLLLGYVNGEIDGKMLCTTDIIPEYPNDDILYQYNEYSGKLKFSIQEIGMSRKKRNKMISCDFLEFTFKNGVLLKVIELV